MHGETARHADGLAGDVGVPGEQHHDVCDLVGLAEAPIEVEPDPARSRPSDLPVVCGDASRLREATGWKPMIPLEQTLADTLDAARRATTRMASA